MYEAENTEKNRLRFVQSIESKLSDLEEKNKEMSESEIKNKKLDEILDIVEKILDFNYKNKKGQGLKILTPDQMFCRLPITLAQLKAGNNSEKLIKEIRKLLYSLYRSKK